MTTFLVHLSPRNQKRAKLLQFFSERGLSVALFGRLGRTIHGSTGMLHSDFRVARTPLSKWFVTIYKFESPLQLLSKLGSFRVAYPFCMWFTNLDYVYLFFIAAYFLYKYVMLWDKPILDIKKDWNLLCKLLLNWDPFRRSGLSI